MRPLLTALFFSGTLSLLTAAGAQDIPGKQSFEDGVAAAQAQRWQEARSHFEASLVQTDKPATRFNLVLANEQLDQPLEILRHALAFLALPEQSEHAAARTRARELVARSTARVAVLTTDGLSAPLELQVDGAPAVAFADGRIYLAPGPHRLETKHAGATLGASVVELTAGQVAAWPQPEVSAPEPPVRVEEPPPTASHAAASTWDADAGAISLRSERTRTPIAWALGSMGAASYLSALGVFLGALHRADEFGERDLFQPGVREARDDSLRLQNAVLPLALTGGGLMAGAIATGAHSRRAGSLAWSIGSIAAGSGMAAAGLAISLHEPPPVPDTNLPMPTRQVGYLLASSALPLLTYGIGFLLTYRRERARQVTALFSSGVRW